MGPKVKKDDKNWWKPGVVIFTKVSASVAIPIIFALFIGKYLDTKYGTTPWIFLGLTAIAFVISLISIWRSLAGYMKKLEKEEPK
jgi:F0F1-type ATP synthase assembly protein I